MPRGELLGGERVAHGGGERRVDLLEKEKGTQLFSKPGRVFTPESWLEGVDAGMYGRILYAGGRKTGYAQSMAMSKLQEIEKAIELLPLADQLRLYCDIPHLIGRDREDLEWQRLAIEEFFKDDSPDDAVYDSI